MDWPTWIGAVAVAGSAIVAAREYRLKAIAERRLTSTALAEADVKLLTLFTELMLLANARGGTTLSETAATTLLAGWDPKKPVGPDEFRALLNQAVVIHPVGEATQAGAMRAIAELGRRYPTLKDPAAEAIAALAYIESTSSGLKEPFRRARDLIGSPEPPPS